MQTRSASARAFSVIMMRGVKRDNVVRFALSLNDKETEEATDTFHRQGPRLWGFWCKAMDERKKNNMIVPVVFR
jgi:hypothetical protein